MILHINTSFTVTVNPSDTINEVKEKIQEVIGLVPSNQELSTQVCVNEQQFLEDGTVSSNDLKDHTEVILTVLSSAPVINIRIMKNEDEVVDLSVDRNMTIGQLKTTIQETMGHPRDQQRIIFRGQQLKDNKTLDECKVKNDNVLHLTLRPIVNET